jgi:hypothetical protein
LFHKQDKKLKATSVKINKSIQKHFHQFFPPLSTYYANIVLYGYITIKSALLRFATLYYINNKHILHDEEVIYSIGSYHLYDGCRLQ